ncbi:polypeptide N-acetylgalactosaminyltransferase 18-like isoform X2 [Petromyzon marinus]|uniref:polypeptide N-acetylgalactosaminyltransferase 18-like isoform X2 n=1 Tax=Petromyzon marinus TaxID=7757 RepID=UPI003F711892
MSKRASGCWVGGWVGGWAGGWVSKRASGWVSKRASGWVGGWVSHRGIYFLQSPPATPERTPTTYPARVAPEHSRPISLHSPETFSQEEHESSMAVARRSSLLCVALLFSCLVNLFWFQRGSTTTTLRDAVTGGEGRALQRSLERVANGPLVETLNDGTLTEQLNDIETMLEKILKGLHKSDGASKKEVVCEGNQWVPDPETPLFKEWGKELPARQKRKACARFLTYGYNAYLSDRLPLDRDVPDNRPPGCSSKRYPSELPALSLVLIFYNEAVSILLRAVTSAVRNTPHHLLKEIILVDDCSDYDDLQEGFDSLVKELGRKYDHVKFRLERHTARRGLSASRVTGIRAASGPVVAVMDAHVEFPIGWAEPILARIQEDRRVVVSTVFDNTHYDTFVVHRYESQAQTFTWQLWCTYREPPLEWITNKDPTAPIRSPIVMGCMAASKSYLEEIGFLDEGMQVYGGENVELGLRVMTQTHNLDRTHSLVRVHTDRYRRYGSTVLPASLF